MVINAYQMLVSTLVAGAFGITPPLQHNRRLQSSSSDPYVLCPIGSSTTTKPNINKNGSRFQYVSYMEFSTQKVPLGGNSIVWVGSDGRQNSLSAVDLVTGDVIKTYTLSNVNFEGDYETITLGPCSSSQNDKSSCIYMGDLGNDGAVWCEEGQKPCDWGRKFVNIYKFVEPNLYASNGDTNIIVATIRIEYDHPDLPIDRYNCELFACEFTVP